LCAAAQLELGEDKCREVPDIPQDRRCGLDLICRTDIAFELPAGVQAWLARSGRAQCGRAAAPSADGGQAVYECNCSGWGPAHAYAVRVNEAEQACRSTLGVYLSDQPPSFGASSCTGGAESIDATHCEATQVCGPELRLNEDATLIEMTSRRELSCEGVEGGGSSCTCAILKPLGFAAYQSVEAYAFSVATEPVLDTCDPSLCYPGHTTQ
jgi:hypothetical protein